MAHQVEFVMVYFHAMTNVDICAKEIETETRAFDLNRTSASF